MRSVIECVRRGWVRVSLSRGRTPPAVAPHRPAPRPLRRGAVRPGVFLRGLIKRALGICPKNRASCISNFTQKKRQLSKSHSHVQLRRVPFAPAGSAAELVRCTALRGVHLEDLRHPHPHHHPNHHLHPPHHSRPSPSRLPSCRFAPSCTIGHSSRIPHGSCGASGASTPTLRHTHTGRSPRAG